MNVFSKLKFSLLIATSLSTFNVAQAQVLNCSLCSSNVMINGQPAINYVAAITGSDAAWTSTILPSGNTAVNLTTPGQLTLNDVNALNAYVQCAYFTPNCDPSQLGYAFNPNLSIDLFLTRLFNGQDFTQQMFNDYILCLLNSQLVVDNGPEVLCKGNELKAPIINKSIKYQSDAITGTPNEFDMKFFTALARRSRNFALAVSEPVLSAEA